MFGLTPKQDQSIDSRQDAVAAALTGATPEQLAALRRADQDYAAKMAELGFKDREALAQLAVEEEQAYLADAQDARRANAANECVFWLGVAVLATFAGVCFGALWGAYALLTGKIPVTDAAVVGTSRALSEQSSATLQ
ncbi:hypothetical protein [Burkholderia ubonensis]|uniref:hypothetical protein n=1 Tax=Burkholderia ubonensis TaxID=101571 RepID=UPI00211C36F4|nr:hypothetical protein [Burkholderia ubonensis]